MNDVELINEIKRLYEEEKISKDRLLSQTEDGQSIFLKEDKDLRDEYENSGFKAEAQKWHHVVRIALDIDDERDYMYNQILKLIRKHGRSSQNTYFKVERGGEQSSIPSITDFNRLEILYNDYLKIYKDIKNKINFDNLKKKQIGSLRGKINWMETIQRSPVGFPIEFVTNISQRKFDTSENILLIICAKWLYRESRRLLRTSLTGLPDDERKILYKIFINSKLIIENFPFKEVVQKSGDLWKLPFDHMKIKKLENDATKRIVERKIRNLNYEKLLEWMDRFRELDLQKITGETSTKDILRSPKDIDTMYELWVFLEFIEYLREKFGYEQVDCEFGDRPYCRFDYEGNEITFWWEKTFSVGKGKTNSWAVDHRPDYIAMIGDERLAVFDAKNYAQSSSISNPQNKMLAYMNNLNVNFGALIFPDHPIRWDELDEEKKSNGLTRELICDSVYYKNQIDNMAEADRKSRIKQIRKEQKKLLWADENFHFKEEFPNAYSKEEYPKHETIPIPERKVLALCRVSPVDPLEDPKLGEMKKETLDFIYNSIVKRAPLTVSS